MHMEVKTDPELDIYTCYESVANSDDFDLRVSKQDTESNLEEGYVPEVEDEPLVEIDSITVPQQLVEADLQPSVLFFVNSHPKICSNSNKDESHLTSTKCHESTKESPAIFSEEEIKKRKSVTRALRNVKRKQHSSDKIAFPNTATKHILDRNDKATPDVDGILSGPGHDSCEVEENLENVTIEDQINEKELVPTQVPLFYKTKKRRHKEISNKIEANEICLKRIRSNRIPGKSPAFKKVLKNNRQGRGSPESSQKMSSQGASDENRDKTYVIEPAVRSNNKVCVNLNEIKLKKDSLTFFQNELDSKEDLAAHSKSHTGTKPDSFDCTVCGKKFREKSHLATHSRAHVEIRNFKCNECGGLFKTKTNLFFHMKTHEEAPFICDRCNKTFPERKILMRHKRVVHSGEGVYNCDQCGRSFKNSQNLQLHYTLHTGNKPYTCNVCRKSFVYKSTYTTHLKAHEADNQFHCDLCPRDVVDKAELRRRCSHHSEARPWLCAVCGKGYPLKSTLKHHLRTHDPEKPFKCKDCGKAFVKKSSYECHLKSHSGENPPFMCDQCSLSYYNVFALKRHYLKHTGERRFFCDICNKAFWMKDALKVHKRSHANFKMFSCIHCSKSFVHKHNLVAHLRTHSAENQFPCPICLKSFSHKYNRDRHQRQHSMPVINAPPLSPSFIMVGPPKHIEFPTLHIL